MASNLRAASNLRVICRRNDTNGRCSFPDTCACSVVLQHGVRSHLSFGADRPGQTCGRRRKKMEPKAFQTRNRKAQTESLAATRHSNPRAQRRHWAIAHVHAKSVIPPIARASTRGSPPMTHLYPLFQPIQNQNPIPEGQHVLHAG